MYHHKIILREKLEDLTISDLKRDLIILDWII